MIKISHRGLTLGPNNFKDCGYDENSPARIEWALRNWDVEVDLFCQNGRMMLGHDRPLYEISRNFLINYANKLWIHCKNVEALLYMRGNLPELNYFYHDNDDAVLTSQGFIWHYPQKGPWGHNSICVLPEWGGDYNKIPVCYGVCSDYVGLINGII